MESKGHNEDQYIYVLDILSYALRIWLIEATLDIGTLFGWKYKDVITRVM